MRFHVERLLLGLLLAALSLPAAAQGLEVHFPGPGVELAGRLYLPDGAKGRAPAIVLMHGCSGMWGRDGQPGRNYEAWAEHFRKLGYVALLVDSFGPRGQNGDLHSEGVAPFRPARDRPRDAYAALVWLGETRRR